MGHCAPRTSQWTCPVDLPEVRWLRARDAAPGHGPLGPLKKWTRGVPPYFRFPRVGLAIGAATQHLGPEPLCGRPQREPRNRPPVGLEACDGCNIWAQMMMMMTIMLTMMMSMMMVMVMMMVVMVVVMMKMLRLTGACWAQRALQAPLGLEAQRGPEAPLMMMLMDGDGW